MDIEFESIATIKAFQEEKLQQQLPDCGHNPSGDTNIRRFATTSFHGKERSATL